jgi:hypothetical protein
MATTLQVEPPQPPLRRRRWALGLSVAALAVAPAWPVTSYVRALTYPGQASFLVRTMEWVRDNGGDVATFTYTWRSGLGVDAAGNLVYVGGSGLNLVTLANALVQAGAVRGLRDFFVVILR